MSDNDFPAGNDAKIGSTKTRLDTVQFPFLRQSIVNSRDEAYRISVLVPCFKTAWIFHERFNLFTKVSPRRYLLASKNIRPCHEFSLSNEQKVIDRNLEAQWRDLCCSCRGIFSPSAKRSLGVGYTGWQKSSLLLGWFCVAHPRRHGRRKETLRGLFSCDSLSFYFVSLSFVGVYLVERARTMASQTIALKSTRANRPQTPGK